MLKRGRYERIIFFAKVARKEGYNYLGKIFEESAANEERHAKDHLQLLKGISDTAANLQRAIDGENYEAADMYPTFAKEAEEEGNMEAANLFKQIAKIEERHRNRYLRCLEMVTNGTVFKREQAIKWKCSKLLTLYQPQKRRCYHVREKEVNQ